MRWKVSFAFITLFLKLGCCTGSITSTESGFALSVMPLAKPFADAGKSVFLSACLADTEGPLRAHVLLCYLHPPLVKSVFLVSLSPPTTRPLPRALVLLLCLPPAKMPELGPPLCHNLDVPLTGLYSSRPRTLDVRVHLERG